MFKELIFVFCTLDLLDSANVTADRKSEPNDSKLMSVENTTTPSIEPGLWTPNVRAAVEAPKLGSSVSPRNRLIEKLLTGYLKGAIPVLNHGDQLKVRIQAKLFQIIDVSLASNTIKATAGLQMFWNDQYLTWDPNEFGGAKSVYIPAKDVWTPELSVYYSVESEIMSIPNNYLEVKVTHRGDVAFVVSFTVHALCPFDCKYFPFDAHTCEVIFGSMVHTIDTLDVDAVHPVILDNFYDNQEWLLDDCRIEKGYLHLQGFGDETKVGTLVLQIKIHRQSFYYIFILVTPATLITFLAVVGFHIPHAPTEMRTAKFQLGQITLLSMSVLLVGISSELPKFSVRAIPGNRGSFSHVPLLGIFYLSLLVLVMASTLTCSMLVVLERQVQNYDDMNAWLDSFATFAKFKRRKNDQNQKRKSPSLKGSPAEDSATANDISFFQTITEAEPEILSPEKLASVNFDARHFAYQLYIIIRNLHESHQTLMDVHETLAKTNMRSIRARRAGLLARRIEKYLFAAYLLILAVLLFLFFEHEWWY